MYDNNLSQLQDMLQRERLEHQQALDRLKHEAALEKVRVAV